jgi:hypothetical protein
VIKEIKPKLVATYTDKPGVNEGHPFLIEAAISLGGSSVKEGVNIFRFANRIPLLFETGADVVTQVATKRIKWNLYHIDPKKDAIGVYVSIVSTRIPFKGTSKEYIGDDVLEIQYSVKRALVGCCQQLRQLLHESLAKREMNEKRKLLVKSVRVPYPPFTCDVIPLSLPLCRYIPDISRSLTIVMQNICDKEDEQETTTSSSLHSLSEKQQLLRLLAEQEDTNTTSTTTSSSVSQRAAMKKRKVSENILRNKLSERAKKISSENLLMFEVEEGNGDGGEEENGQKSKKRKMNSSSSLPLVNYCLEVEQPKCHELSMPQSQGQDKQLLLVRDIPIKVESSQCAPSGVSGRWVLLKGGLDSGGVKIWIPSRELRTMSFNMS